MDKKQSHNDSTNFFKSLFGINKEISKTHYRILAALYLIIFLLIWEFFFPTMIPRIGDIFSQLGVLISEKGVIYELGQSIKRVMKVMLYSVPLALFISAAGAIFNFMKPIAKAIPPFRFFALLGFAAIIRNITGNGDSFQTVAFLFALVPWLTTGFNTLFESIEKKDLFYGKTMGYSPLRNAWYVYIRSNAAAIYKIIRNNFAIAWMMMVTIEIANRDGGGIGAMIFDYTRFVVDENLYAATFALNLIVFACGIFLDFLFRKLVLTLPEEKSKNLKN